MRKYMKALEDIRRAAADLAAMGTSAKYVYSVYGEQATGVGKVAVYEYGLTDEEFEEIQDAVTGLVDELRDKWAKEIGA